MMEVPDRSERRAPDELQKLAEEHRAREAVVRLECDRHPQLLGSTQHALEPSRDVSELSRRAAEHAHRRRAPLVRQLEGRRQLAIERPRKLDRCVETDERYRSAGERRPDGTTSPGVEREDINRLSVEQAELEPLVAVLTNCCEHSFERPIGRREVRDGDPHSGVVTLPERRSASRAAYAGRSTGSRTA